MSVRRFAGLIIVSYLLLLPTTAWAQAAGGTLAGVVRDTSGAVLPGVAVEAASPALIEKVRTVVTDGQGQYRIVDLRPGPYTVTFSLPGFATVKREGVELTTSFTATVNADMKVGAIEETVTVTGETSVVDIQNVRQQTTVGRAVLDAIPTTKRMGQYASFIPGATYDSPSFHDVGGSQGEGGRFAVHGQRAGDFIANFEGMNQNTGQGDIISSNAQTFQEIVVETSGTSAEATTGGVQMNIIPKDGGNRLSGSYSSSYTSAGLQADNLTDELRARGLQEGSSIRKSYDHGGALGGPIKRDTLWFFTAHRWWGSSRYVQGSYYNKLQGTLFYEPDLDRVMRTAFYYVDNSLRLTWQAAQKHKIVGSFALQHACSCPSFGPAVTGTAITAVRPTPESLKRGFFNPLYNPVVTWSYPATNRLLFEAAASAVVWNAHSEPMPEVGPNDIRVTDLARNLSYGSIADSNLWPGTYGKNLNAQHNSRFAVSYITGSHTFKTGFNLKRFNQGREGRYTDINQIHQARSYTFRNQVPVSVTIWAVPFELVEHTTGLGVFAQDQWTMRKLTLNLGLRYDSLNGSVPEHHLPAGIFVPARDFPAVKNVPDWKNLDPRVGVAYDLFGNGRTALKASLGRYVPYVIAAANNPASNQAASTTRNWTDSNGNYVPDCDLLNPVANLECGAWSDLTFARVRAGTRFADDALTGFNKEFHNWQGSVAIQQELRPGIALNVGYFRSWYGNFLVTKNLAVTPADFDSYCITVPTDSRLPNSGQQLCGFSDLKPALFGVTDNLRTQASNYGKRSEVYNGVDLTLTARFAQGGQFSGGLNVGRTVTDACEVVANVPEALLSLDPANNAGPGTLSTGTSGSWSPAQYCHVSPPWSAGTQLKFLVIYPLPWDLQASAIYQNAPGIPITATFPASNAQIRPSLGRDVGSCRGAATCSANVNTVLTEPGTRFEDRLQQLDLRLTRRFQVGQFRVRGSVDVSNVLNAAYVLSMNAGFGSQWLVPFEAIGGRVFRFTGQLDF